MSAEYDRRGLLNVVVALLDERAAVLAILDSPELATTEQEEPHDVR